VDALAVDLLPEDERGKANGLMYGSKYLGGAIGGAGMATVMASSGIRAALLLQVTVLGLIFLLPLLLRERPGERLLPWTAGEASETTKRLRADSVLTVFRSLLRAMSFRASLLTGALALTISTSAGLLGVVGVLFIVQDLGWSDTDYSQITGGWGLAFGLVGSVLGGFVADRMGHRRTIAAGCIALSVLWVVFALAQPLWQIRSFVITMLLLDALFTSLATVGFFALAMGVSWPKVAATQFTAYMALANMSAVSGAWIAGKIDGLLSIPSIYLLCAGLQLLVAALLLGIDVGQVRRELGSGASPSPPAEGT
jgi:PAT family beta-lactamase induction signal transducer AmpG